MLLNAACCVNLPIHTATQRLLLQRQWESLYLFVSPGDNPLGFPGPDPGHGMLSCPSLLFFSPTGCPREREEEHKG